MIVFTVIAIVSAALILGAWIGIAGWLGDKSIGFLLALAGGSLIVAVITEMIQPALEETPLFPVMIAIGIGGMVFSCANYLIDEKLQNAGGGGLLAAVTLDGIPENLALGVTLIGAGPWGVAALAGSIFLSNLPEAAGSAQQMQEDGRTKSQIILMWFGTAAILAAAALVGYYALETVDGDILNLIKAFAAGTVIASLASEVFPDAYKESRHMTGVAVTIGAILALCLTRIGGHG